MLSLTHYHILCNINFVVVDSVQSMLQNLKKKHAIPTTPSEREQPPVTTEGAGCVSGRRKPPMAGDETLPILVGGDINIIRRRDEKNNDNFDGRWSIMFNMIIESLNLREIELTDR